MRESTVERSLVQLVKSQGGECHKYKTLGRKNSPDRILLSWRGRVAFCECKRPGEEPTPAQLREHNRLRARGFTVGVVSTPAGVVDFVTDLIVAGFFER